MSGRMVPVLYHHLLFLILLTPGGSTQKKNASHVPLKRCALNESSVELHVTIPGSVVEGTRAILTCNTTCSLTAPTFIWYKNGRPLTKKTIENNQLHLQTVSSEDAGSYSCAVRGSQHLRSAAQSLRVRYRPKGVSVSISPSGEIVEGSSVTLTCSSDGYPPVEHKWFKGTLFIVKEKNYTITKASSVDSGEYKCKCMNELGEKYSEALTLDVWYPPKNVSVSISPSGEIVEGSSATLTCSSDGNPPVECHWFIGTLFIVKEKNYTITKASSVDSGEYKCKCMNEHGDKYSEALTLDVWYPPKNVLVSISPSGEIVEGSSVTLTCSSDGNPPVKNYTWFKEGGTSLEGSGPNYSIFSITADHKGWYHCEAWNKLGKQNASVALLLHPVHGYMTVCVTVGLAFTGAVITVCFVYLMIRRAKRTVQNSSPAVDVYSTPGCGSSRCDEVRTPSLLALSRPHDDMVLNAYATTEETYIDLNAAGSSFFEAYQALDDTYMVPEYTEELYANVPIDSAGDAYRTHEDGSSDYGNVN